MSHPRPAYGVIMAGGIGSRFWPVSTEEKPKQFLDLTGSGRSLLQQTYDRLTQVVPARNILVLTNKRYVDQVREQLPGIPAEHILAEPVMRNTAPAILLAANYLAAKDPHAVMAVTPADHYIAPASAFAGQLKEALEYAGANEVLLTMGIRPREPHTGYGYIQYDPGDSGRFKKVLRFTEKPDKETARLFLKEGNYLWNSGIFIWQVPVIRQAFAKFLPQTYEALNRIDYRAPGLQAQIDKYFPAADHISIDYGILEKATDVKVLPATFEWNDLGSWDALYKQLRKNPGDNVVINGRLLQADAMGNLIYTDRHKDFIIDGLADHLIVDLDDIQLILPLDKAQEVKKWRQKWLEQKNNSSEIQ